MLVNRNKIGLVDRERALPGRETPIALNDQHFVFERSMTKNFPQNVQILDIGMGCFWGAERLMWKIPGIWVTAVGYQGGFTPNPTYEEVCSGQTGHAETVRIVYAPDKVSIAQILEKFWENHDPTQGMRQGNDIGTQYRSALYWHDEDQHQAILESRQHYAQKLSCNGFDDITTEIGEAPVFYFAENDHQQYLAKNPDGYCGLRGTGVTCA